MNIFIMALEPLETRYTGEWFYGIPTLVYDAATERGKTIRVYNIAGEQTSTDVTSGAFLNFTATNIWKNTQLNTLAQYFSDGTIRPGDKVLFADAWHTGVIQTKYMSELMDIPVEIHSMWHAGSYDPQDFLGRKVKDKSWSFSVERAYYEASDFNYFATEFHLKLFEETLYVDQPLGMDRTRSVISGQPHRELMNSLLPYEGMTKRDLVLFPHRVAPEKQPEIFRDLAQHMPDVEFVVCQDTKLTKQEYHRLLGEAKVVFSANLQETLGISAMEGILVGTIPMLPNRLSYSEMYSDSFMYPSRWTQSWGDYVENRDKLILWLRNALTTDFTAEIAEQRNVLTDKFLTAKPMLDKLLN